MSTPTWITLANANQFNQAASGTAVSNFITATDVSPGGNTLGQAYQTQPAQLYPGQMWRFTANGIWSSTSSPGVSLGVYYGGAAGSPLCYGSVAAGSALTNCASLPWMLTAVGKLTAVGSSSAIWQVIGTLVGLQPPPAFQGVTGTPGVATVPTMMPQYTTAAQYNTASPQLITLAATTTASSASNILVCYNWAIEYMTEP